MTVMVMATATMLPEKLQSFVCVFFFLFFFTQSNTPILETKFINRVAKNKSTVMVFPSRICKISIKKVVEGYKDERKFFWAYITAIDLLQGIKLTGYASNNGSSSPSLLKCW